MVVGEWIFKGDKMDYENRLLSRALHDKNLSPMFARGVNDSWFNDDLDKRVWKFVREHHTNYGQSPSFDVLADNFPTFVAVKTEDSIEFLIDKVIEQRRKAIINTSFREAILDIEKDKNHEAALGSIQRGMARLEEEGLTAASDTDITEDAEQRWDEYIERKNLPNGMRGMATGFPSLDRAISGVQKGQLIVIAAPPKTGKSTLILQMAQNIHNGGKVPVFQSFEMSNDEQTTRYDAMRARISHHRLLTGTLTPEEESRYKAKLRGMSMMQHKFWLSESASSSTISGLSNKIQMLQPEVLFIDGVYLMVDEQSGEANTAIALTNITRSLKRLAQQYQIPIIISTQTLEWKMNKGQVTASSIGYSSSFFQDADILLGLQREDENVDDTRVLKLMAGRNASPMEVSLVWDWNTGEFREINGDDM
jgi:replicative DNA helicase